MTLNDESNESVADEAFDTTRRFVRVTQVRPDGFVEFDFAIGEPELFVELILSEQAYAEFCAANDVVVLPSADHEILPDGNPDDLHWRLSDVPPGHH